MGETWTWENQSPRVLTVASCPVLVRPSLARPLLRSTAHHTVAPVECDDQGLDKALLSRPTVALWKSAMESLDLGGGGGGVGVSLESIHPSPTRHAGPQTTCISANRINLRPSSDQHLHQTRRRNIFKFYNKNSASECYCVSDGSTQRQHCCKLNVPSLSVGKPLWSRYHDI